MTPNPSIEPQVIRYTAPPKVVLPEATPGNSADPRPARPAQGLAQDPMRKLGPG